MEPFFPTYKSHFTKTPNVFFDEILMDESATINEIRIIAYLIRHTLGYHKEAKWIGVTRENLIQNAKVSGSRIAPTIKSCEIKGWILTYMEGVNGSQKRYIFLNDDLNSKIVHCLRQGHFTVGHLEYLNIAGIVNLIERFYDGDPYHHETPSIIKEDLNAPQSSWKGSTTTTVKGADRDLNRSTNRNPASLKKDLDLNKNNLNNKDPRYQKFYELFPND